MFHIVAPFKGGKFDPSPYPPRKMKDGVTPNVWPPLDGIDGTFELKENVLRFDVDRARYKRVALNKVNGKIDDLGTKASSLVINGDGHGPLADMIDYVNASPLGGLSKHVGEKMPRRGARVAGAEAHRTAHAKAAYRRRGRIGLPEQPPEHGQRAAVVATDRQGALHRTYRPVRPAQRPVPRRRRACQRRRAEQRHAMHSI